MKNYTQPIVKILCLLQADVVSTSEVENTKDFTKDHYMDNDWRNGGLQ